MAFVVLGVLLTLLKWTGLSFVAHWSWWAVLSPFAAAAAWWVFADMTGYTQRKAMQRADERAAKRRDEQYERLGMRPGPLQRNGQSRAGREH